MARGFKAESSLVFFLAAAAETARTDKPVALDLSDRRKAEENTLAIIARWRGTRLWTGLDFV